MNTLVLFCLLYRWRRQRLLADSTTQASDPPRRIHTRYLKKFWKSLSDRQRRRRDKRIPRNALLSTRRSPWRRVLHSQSDQALITVTGLDHATLHYALELFAPLFDNYTPHNCDIIRAHNPKLGRPRKIRPEDCMGILLCWSRTQGSLIWLQMVFGMTYSNLAVYLTFGIRLWIEVFRRHPISQLRLPSREKIHEYQESVARRHPILPDVWSVMDGLKLPIQKAPGKDTQNGYYNGWMHGHFVTAVFCFVPDGTIPIAYYNVPGSALDSNMCDLGGIYAKLERVYKKTGGKCAVDSAFAARRCPFLIKSGSEVYYSNRSTRAGVRYDIRRKREATSLRQSAEWGMRALQSSFPRLKNKFKYEENGSRSMMLKALLLLYNMRACRVGINQIQNVYQPLLDQDAGETLGV